MRYLILVSIVWALSFGLIGSRLVGLDAYFVATVRLGLALLVLLPFFRWTHLRGADALRLFGCGAIQFGLMYLCYMQAFAYLPSHVVALFSVTTPLYVVLIHDIRQRRWTPIYFAAAALSVAGAAVIKATGFTPEGVWIGFGWMQGAGLAFAFGQVYYRDWKRARPDISDSKVFSLLYAGGFFLALAASISQVDWAALTVTPTQWTVLIYLGLVASGGGFFLWNKGASQTNPGTLAAFNNAVVPLAMMASLFVFGEITRATPGDLLRLAAGAACIAGACHWGTVVAARRKN